VTGAMAADERILVIKHGALGDFVLAMGPFAAIRSHHARAHITLLTAAPYADLARRSGWFDEVWIDDRPGWGRPGGWWALRRRLRAGGFVRVYDLQTSDRSSAYLRLFPRRGRPEWSGIAPGASHPHANPRRNAMHTVERQREQLAMAGIPDVPAADLSWLDADITRYRLPARLVLLVPGGSPNRPGKRWPAEHYAALADMLIGEGLAPVLLGTEAERDVLAAVATGRPEVVNLAGQTDFAEIAALARRAAGAVGNDTGPMHLIAAAGCPSVVLFSAESDPALCAPRGPAVTVLREERLGALGVEAVWEAFVRAKARTAASGLRTSESA